jgi:Domain of unknown function (DUF1707)
MRAAMLASDRERQATVLRLRAAHLEGRLATEELELRIGRAEAARTREDLAALEADLPARSGPAITTTSGVPRMPGRRHFTERKLLDAPLEEVLDAALAFVVPPLERCGYFLHQEGDDVLVFQDVRHGPRGRLMVRFRDAGDNRTLVLAHGVAPLAVRRAFATLSD